MLRWWHAHARATSPDADGDRNVHPNALSYPDSDGNALSCNSYSYADAVPHAIANPNTNSDPHANRDAYSHADAIDIRRYRDR